MNEITFISNCRICGAKNVSCRVHHLIPQRLLAILPKTKVREWEFQKVD